MGANNQSTGELKTIADLLGNIQTLLERNNTTSQKSVENSKKQRKEAEKTLTVEQKKKKVLDDTEKGLKSFAAEYKKLSPQIQAQLEFKDKESSIYKEINAELQRQKAIATTYNGVVKQNAEYRAEALESVAKEAAQAAQAAAIQEDKARGINETQRKILDIESKRSVLGNSIADKLIDQIKQTEQLELKTKRLQEIEKLRGGLMDSLPGPFKELIGFAKSFAAAVGLGLGPLFLLVAVVGQALKSFIGLEQAAEDFRKETGLLNSQMEDVRSQANQITQEFAEIGVESKDVFDTVSKLKGEFGDTVNFSKETVAALTVMNKNFGIAAESSAKVQSIFESVGGLSGETAANVQLQVANMAKMAGVAPDKVFKDIAENAEAASTFFKGDLTALTKNAVQARRMGTSLKEQVSLAEKLLDFENGIEQELVAATFVGGQFNLSRARALAMEGKLAEANEETLKQIQRSGDFKKKDYFTQQQLAKAAGMSVEEINKQLDAQEKLNSLSGEQKKAAEDAINAGLDITNISKENLASETEKFAKQQEQQQVLDKISNQFMGIASTIGSVLVPVLDAVALALNVILMPITIINDMFGWIGEKISALLGPLSAVGKFMKGLAGIAIIYAAYKAFASFATVPVVGAIKGGIAAAAILAAGFGALSKVGDLASPADGKTQVSTKEGGLFELSPNDDLVAAPGAAAALADGKGGAGGAAVNLAALSAPLNALLGEIKALRADMNSGKIAVHMDGAKVTSGIAKQVEKNSRNNFAMSQA
jgi:hypothetical protein